MRSRSANRSLGFSLMELMISLTLGVAVVGSAVQLFRQGMNANWLVSQRAEMQQDFRAASVMLTKDISLAGAGMQNVSNAIALPTSATPPVYGCDQTPKCYINGKSVAYPTQLVNGKTVPYLYGIVPGSQYGIKISPYPNPSDTITIAYTDTDFLLSCYKVTFSNSQTAVFTLPSPLPSTCVLPPTLTAPQAVNDAVVGLTPGDLVWFQAGGTAGTTGTTATCPIPPCGVTGNAVGEVTNVVANGSGVYTVTFASGDPLYVNQPSASSGNIAAIAATPAAQGTRLLVVTYYLDISPIDNKTPRLMRMTSGHTPVPLAENVAYLQLSYNTNNNGVFATYADGGLSVGINPTQITSANVVHMSMHSQLSGTTGFQGLDLETTVSTRNLTFNNQYQLSTN
jgi:hypothetical protein